MSLIRASIERPVAVISVVLMTVMFGWLALTVIPVQLAPDVQRPSINISTFWPGAAPAEVEREIIDRQEDVLKGIEGLERIEGTANRSLGSIKLEFKVGTNMDKAMLLISNRLDQVTGYPDEAVEPLLSTAGENDNPMAWFILSRAPGNETPIHEYGSLVEDVLRDALERIKGVGKTNAFGAVEEEMQVIVRPDLMASYGITVGELITKARQANVAMSAGTIEEGKRRYSVRTEGEFDTLDKVRNVVIRSTIDPQTGQAARVMLGQIADVRYGYKDPGATIRFMGKDAVAMNAVRETGANVIATMRDVRKVVQKLNELHLQKKGLVLTQVYDETLYIDAAINLVQSNILIGGMLAIVILVIFLRSVGATIIISAAIPVSIVGSFVAMAALGRSVNVISLAGLAFAVGMVVDAAIVVLENIYRLRQQGKSAAEASYEGAQQVWGAILVSALTTVLVFIPILVLELEVGQLFRDIAVAISVAVMLSLLVSVTVIPALSNVLMGNMKKQRRIPYVDGFGRLFVTFFTKYTFMLSRSRAIALIVVVFISVCSAGLSVALKPKMDYLPNGNRNLLMGFLIPPPGYNLQTSLGIAEQYEKGTRDLWTHPDGIGREDVDTNGEGEARIARFFFVAIAEGAFANFTIVGVVAEDPTRVKELQKRLKTVAVTEPGLIPHFMQPSLFGSGMEGTSAIDINIKGNSLADIVGLMPAAFGMALQTFPPVNKEGKKTGNSAQPIPGELSFGAPEVRVIPLPIKLADAGVTATELGLTVDTYNDGLRLAEISVEGKRIDLMLKGPDGLVKETQGIRAIPVVTPSGKIVNVEALANVIDTASTTQIRHVDRQRTVTVRITPADMSLEAAMDLINQNIVPALRKMAPDGVEVEVAGTANKLDQTWNSMKWMLLIALVIVYLVMAILFDSFLYPLVVMVSVPLATAGAMIGLAALNGYMQRFDEVQNLDMLTLLGFVILIGIVVNNAILLVHQTLHHIRQDAMLAGDAIIEATRNRIRPIFMSTLTSVFGMLPLVLFPGAGSELYRGLGAVVLGGLSLSAVLTLFIVPPLLIVVLGGATAKNEVPKT